MKEFVFTWDRVLETARLRPDGYLDDIRQAGTVHYSNGEPSVVTFTEEAYEALKRKYRPGYQHKPASPKTAHPSAPPPAITLPPSVGPGTEVKALL